MPTDPHHTPTILKTSSSQPKKTHKPRKPKRKVTQVPQLSGPTESVADEAVYKELDDSLVRAATTASSLEAEQDSGNIDKTQSKATPNEFSSQGTDSCGGPKVIELEKTKTTQANEIESLKKRVKKLERRNKSRTHKLKRLYKVGLIARVESSGDEQSLDEDASKQGRIKAIDADEDITLDKRKGIMVEEPVKHKKKDQIRLDEEAALKLQAELQAKMFDRALNRVNTFVDFKTELLEGSSKRAGEDLTQESAKKQKVDDDKEIIKLKQLMKIILNEEERIVRIKSLLDAVGITAA
nr:hypothetical protein [Tanacetum cinerariifolium]